MRLPVSSIWQDVRFGARVLQRDRGFTLAAVLLLGLGLGVNTTVFTIVNAMNLRGLPVERADQILQINSLELGGRQRESYTSYADFRDWQRGTRTFAGLAAYTGGTMTIGDAVLDGRSLLTARIAAPPAKYATPEQRHAFYQQSQERLDVASSSIASATLATARPFVDANTRQLVLEGETFTPENPLVVVDAHPMALPTALPTAPPAALPV